MHAWRLRVRCKTFAGRLCCLAQSASMEWPVAAKAQP